MKTTQNVSILDNYLKKVKALKLALTTMSFDQQTIAPKAGSDYRINVMGYLSGEIFSLLTSPNYKQILDELNQTDLSAEQKRLLEYLTKDYNDVCSIPKQEYIDYQILTENGSIIWEKAKNNNDYSQFSSTLQQLVIQTKKIIEYRQSDQNIYDQLLQNFEFQITRKQYDKFFDTIKKELIPFIKKVHQQKQIDTSFLNQSYPIDQQKQFAEILNEFLNYDNSWGYMCEAVHPFSSSFSINDCRITTKYLDNLLQSSIFAIIHEVGHATYNHQINPNYENTAFAEHITFSMHESQSRLFENYLGRKSSFWDTLYPKLQKLFPKQLDNVTQSQFVDAINASVPSLIRIEADELTYPIHILIRYEIEKDLFDGIIDFDNLENTWNEKYTEYLHVTPKNASKGILQDIHWSGAAFGYFPTYGYGSAIAAQIMNTMEKEIPVDRYLSTGKFDKITKWLKDNVHQYAGRYSADELLLKVTGEKFNASYYINYLKNKYRELYNLQGE